MLPTITSLESGSRCIRSATSSRMAFAVLSTRHGFTLFGNSIWLILVAWAGGGGGGGGASTVAEVSAEAVRPRSSVAVHVTVILPGCAPCVLNCAVVPVPLTVPVLDL